jgi:hypothetical protein
MKDKKLTPDSSPLTPHPSLEIQNSKLKTPKLTADS